MMATARMEATPVFERNFDGLLAYLRDVVNNPKSISPKRFGQVLQIDMQTLATQAHVHRNTISRAPEAESVQKFMRDTVRVIKAATDISGSVENAVYWYKNDPLTPFEYKTAQQLISEGRTDDIVRYISSLQAGFAG
ncbi:MAG: DUF2384 domain-containing protein [Pseudomonadota bacterium]